MHTCLQVARAQGGTLTVVPGVMQSPLPQEVRVAWLSLRQAEQTLKAPASIKKLQVLFFAWWSFWAGKYQAHASCSDSASRDRSPRVILFVSYQQIPASRSVLWLLEILMKLSYYSPRALWFKIPDTCSSRVWVSRLPCHDCQGFVFILHSFLHLKWKPIFHSQFPILAQTQCNTKQPLVDIRGQCFTVRKSVLFDT